MKGKSKLIVALFVVIAVGLGLLSYFGIGSRQILGVGNIRQGLDLRGGVNIVYEADTDNPTSAEMKSAISLIRRRLDNRGYTEGEVSQQGTNRIRVDIPGVEDAEQAVSEIGQTALLTFRSEDLDENGNEVVLLTGAEVADAQRQVSSGSTGGADVVVALKFTDTGKALFEEATANNVGRTIKIYLDEELISAPTVNERITGGDAVISGNFTAESAEELASLIREGSLPFGLKVLSVSNVGATLGADALSTSLIAGLIGIVLVLLFMGVMYKVSGLAADLALVIYVGIVLILLSLLRVTLTLPGIAGIILSIGMAVDANVIIFERMREELALGRTLRSSIDAAFKRALPAIVDGNVTTLIAAAVLFWLGTGPVKGFAQTLAIGIVISMFTALFVTRQIITNFVGAGIGDPRLYGVKK